MGRQFRKPRADGGLRSCSVADSEFWGIANRFYFVIDVLHLMQEDLARLWKQSDFLAAQIKLDKFSS
jgi:hypothetical protein